METVQKSVEQLEQELAELRATVESVHLFVKGHLDRGVGDSLTKYLLENVQSVTKGHFTEAPHMPDWKVRLYQNKEFQRGFEVLGWHMKYEEHDGVKYCVYYLPDGRQHRIPYSVVCELAKLENFDRKIFQTIIHWAEMINHPD